MFSACGVITLTTDFGPQGPFVATMKGRILSRMPEARIIDVTHDVPVYWPAEAGFWLARAYSYFPEGSVHVAVVDPGVGTKRDIIAVVADGHAFLAPDNGLLAPIVGKVPSAEIYRFDAIQAGCQVQAAARERHLSWTRYFCPDRGGTRPAAGQPGGPGAPRPPISCRPGWTNRPWPPTRSPGWSSRPTISAT